LNFQNRPAKSGAQYVCNPGLQPFPALWLVYASPSLTRENSTFSPQSVFVRFVWFSGINGYYFPVTEWLL